MDTRAIRKWTMGAAAASMLVAGCTDGGASGPRDGEVSDAAPGDGAADAPDGDGGGLDSGPGDGAAGDAGPEDGGTDAAPDGGAPSCAPDRLLLTTAMFGPDGTGETAVLDPDTGEIDKASGENDDVDTVAQLVGCTPVLLERTLGRLDLQDPADPLVTRSSIETDPPGAEDDAMFASNPQKIVRTSASKWYVVVLELNEVLVVDPTRTGFDAQVGSIDLSGFLRSGDDDGQVDAADAVLVGDMLYVALGHTWYDVGAMTLQLEGSEIAVIDTTTDEVVDVDGTAAGVQGIELTGDNPIGGLSYDAAGDRLLVGTTGRYGEHDGGIEAVDPSSQSSEGFVLTEADAGRDFAGFALASETRAYVRTNPDFSSGAPSTVWGFDPSTGELDAAATVDDGASGMFLSGEALFVWDGPAVRRFDAASGNETTPGSGPWDVGDIGVFDAARVP